MQPDRLTIGLMLLVGLGLGGPLHADFIPIADFDELLPGPLDGQDGWSAASTTSMVTEDPLAPGNLVLAVTTDSTHLHRGLAVPDGAVRMFFLRFRFTGLLNYSFGLSPLAYPYQFGDFAVELNMADALHTLRINDGGNYVALAALGSDTWYNAWILVDSGSDTAQVFLHSRPGDDATSTDVLAADQQSDFLFRLAGTDLRTFYVKTGGGGSGNAGPLYLDDLYLEDSEALNLANPTVQSPDVNGDGTVDANDWATLGACLSGPQVELAPASCPSALAFSHSDLDRDGDVDLRDAGIFITRLAAE